MTTPGEPRSMRKLATASNTEGSARNESCSHEAGTVFYAIVDGRYQLRDCKDSVLAQKIPFMLRSSKHSLAFFSNLLVLTLAGEVCDLLKWRLPYIENGYIERSAFMKFASIKPDEIAVVKNDTLVPVGRILARHGALPQNFSMLDLIAEYDRLKVALDSA